MYSLFFCASIIAGQCMEHRTIDFASKKDCLEAKHSITYFIKEHNGWAICMPGKV